MKEKGFRNPNIDNNKIDKKFFQEIKCNCPKCNDSRYEIMDGDSDYFPPFEELKGGKISVSLGTISDIEREELFKRLGPAAKNNFENDY